MERNEKGHTPMRPDDGRMPTRDGCSGGGVGNGENHGMSEGDRCLSSRSLAMVYSPYQTWKMIYSPEDALSHGTLFEELYKPLEGCKNGK